MVYVTCFRSGEVLKIIDTDNSFVFSLDIAADNSVFATAAQDGCVRVYSRRHDWSCTRWVGRPEAPARRLLCSVLLFSESLPPHLLPPPVYIYLSLDASTALPCPSE